MAIPKRLPAGAKVAFWTLDARMVEGTVAAPLSADDKRQLFVTDLYMHRYLWIETQHGRSWFEATRLIPLE